MPVRDGELAGDQGRRAFAAFLDDLDQVAAFTIAQRRQEPVVDSQQIELAQTCQQSGIRAIAATDPQVVKEAWHAGVGGGGSISVSWNGNRSWADARMFLTVR